MTLALSLAALCFGVIHIVADHRRAWRTTWWSKPATVLMLLGLVLTGPAMATPYAILVAIGLCFSLAGDVFLMLRPARFLSGLVAFFFAHLAYIAAFAGHAVPVHPVLALGLAALGGVIYHLLRPGLGPLRLPVIAYIAAIVTMVWAAVSGWLNVGGAAAAAAAVGAVFFLASDACLGIARFRRRFAGAQVLTLGTYYVGQWFIALSAGPLGGP